MATKEEIAAAVQDAKDAKDREKAEKIYNKLTSAEPSPDPRDGVRGQKGYAKGGVTRADGCCSKGHTRGKMM